MMPVPHFSKRTLLAVLISLINVRSTSALAFFSCSMNDPKKTPQWMRPESSRKGSVALSMGIRSMLKNRILGREPNEGEQSRRRIVPIPPPPVFEQESTSDELENEDQPKDEQQQELLQQKLTPAPLRMGETTPGSGVVDVSSIAEGESIQDKINRVKSGKMTDEEKKAFLATALSAGMSSRKPLIKPKWDGEAQTVSASPFPSDSILRNFVSGKIQQEKEKTRPKTTTLNLNTNAKKQEYLDMVTNPDRFTRRLKSSTPTQSEDDVSGRVDSVSGKVDDLGARLGMYAMEEEVRRQEAEKDRIRAEELAELEHIQQREAERRAAEATRRQQMQLLQVEEASKRKELEEEKRKKDAEKVAEQQRLASLMEQQEIYWTEKLAKERETRAQRVTLQQTGVTARDYKPTVIIQPIQEDTFDDEFEDAGFEEAMSVQQQQDQDYFTPNEMELLEEAKRDREVDWERNQQAIQWGASHTPGIVPGPGAYIIQTEPDFFEEQARKKQEIDRAREEQLRRLKELNSPLPVPVSRAPMPAPSPPTMPSISRASDVSTPPTRTSPLFRPPRPIKTTYRPTKNTIQDIEEAKRNAEMHRQQDSQRFQQRPVRSSTPPSRVQQRPVRSSKPPSRVQQRPVRSSTPPSNVQQQQQPPVTPRDAQPPTDIVTSGEPYWTKANSVEVEKKWYDDAPSRRPPPPQERTAAAAAPSQPQRRSRPIRMQIPMDDSEEEEGVDVKSSNGMSLADAMRKTKTNGEGSDQTKRSKQWGIDMSRYE